MRIAVVDDIPADREKLAADVVRWFRDRGLPLKEEPVLLPGGEALLMDFVPGRYSVIFLDIYMDGLSGMETARRVRALDGACQLIFVTTSPDFAVESYEIAAAWYLVKPYSRETLGRALERCDMARLEQERFLELPGPGGPQRLLLHRIAWTEYENRRVWVHFKDGRKTQVLLNQGQLSELLLRETFFCDCIKGVLVNFEAVDKLLPDRFLLKTGQSIPVSRLKYREIRDRFFAYSYERARKSLE